jgi:hypothetical protein
MARKLTQDEVYFAFDEGRIKEDEAIRLSEEIYHEEYDETCLEDDYSEDSTAD